MKEVSVEEYKDVTEADEKVLLVDVRSPMEYERGHVAEAINVPLEDIESNLDAFRGSDFIYLICRSGGRSGMAQHLLAGEGITNTANILGGMISWTDHEYPVVGTFSP